MNSFEGVTLRHLLLRYGCGTDVPFEVEAIVSVRKTKTKTEYLLRWKGYKDECNSWEAAEDELTTIF